MSLGSIREVVVSSRHVASALDFYREAFAWEVLARDAEGAVVGVPGIRSGRVRLVEAVRDPRVRPPLLWETGPRLLGIYSRDLSRTQRAIRAAGGRAGPIVDYTIHKPMAEILAIGADDLFWTIPQAIVPLPSPALEADPARLHGELHSAVLNVEDMEAAVAFFGVGGGMSVLFDGELAGEPFERMLGLPRGAGMRIVMLAGAEREPARLELIRFSGVPEAPQHDRAIGLRRLVFEVDDPEAAAAVLTRAGGRAAGANLLLGPVGVEIELRGGGA